MPDISDAELKAFQKTTALYEALQTRLPALEAASTRVKELEGEVTTFKAAAAEATWTGAGITDPKVRRIFSMEHEEQAGVAGGEPDLGKYLAGLAADVAKAPAHLAPFIKPAVAAGASAAAGGAAGGAAPIVKLPDTSVGAKSPAGATPAITAEQITLMDTAQLAAAMPALIQAHPALAQLPSMPGAVAATPAK